MLKGSYCTDERNLSRAPEQFDSSPVSLWWLMTVPRQCGLLIQLLGLKVAAKFFPCPQSWILFLLKRKCDNLSSLSSLSINIPGATSCHPFVSCTPRHVAKCTLTGGENSNKAFPGFIDALQSFIRLLPSHAGLLNLGLLSWFECAYGKEVVCTRCSRAQAWNYEPNRSRWDQGGKKTQRTYIRPS